MTERTMKAMRFTSRGGNLELCHIPVPKPNPDEILLKVLSCGICAGDDVCKQGFLGTQYPKTPGHEVVGIVDEVGSGIKDFKQGDYAGVGWFGGACGSCEKCLSGISTQCSHSLICGTTLDGGYAEYVIVKRHAITRLNKNFLTPSENTPLLCAGVTTFTALRQSGAGPGDVVVIQGIGGLGHLAIQFARKMGFHTVAVSRGTSKQEWAKKLGAHEFFNSEAADTIEKIQSLGGAKAIISTVTDSKAVEKMFPALGHHGKLVLVGALHHPVSLNTLPMLAKQQSFLLWSGATPSDIQDTVKFAVLQDIRPVVEEFPLEKAQEAFDIVQSNKATFRGVLKVSNWNK